MPATASKGLQRVRWTVRLRLTLLYGALFLVSSAALLTITYLLVAHSPLRLVSPTPPQTLPNPYLRGLAKDQRAAELHHLLTRSGITLATMTVLSGALGWVMAGRALRPVRTMAAKARRISEHNLHERLAVTGPADELKDLGDTFDGLLGRLDTAFEAQKRFVANASHELRTPLTLQRAKIEVALADPNADADSLRDTCKRVLVAVENQERLIEALLTLAHSQRGLDRRQPVDIARVTASVLHELSDPDTAGTRVKSDLATAWTCGDPPLIERLVTNLVSNAFRHNVPGGWVHVRTGVGGRPTLYVANSGPVIPPDRVTGLFQPFQRLESRPGDRDGHGLGLSIVAAIATAHGARLTATSGEENGLIVTVAFPPLDDEVATAHPQTGT